MYVLYSTCVHMALLLVLDNCMLDTSCSRVLERVCRRPVQEASLERPEGPVVTLAVRQQEDVRPAVNLNTRSGDRPNNLN